MRILIATVLSLFIAQVALAQCKYELVDIDMITGQQTLKTKEFRLGGKLEDGKKYKIAHADCNFKKIGEQEFIVIKLKGQGLSLFNFKNYNDKLILIFSDGSLDTLKMDKTSTIHLRGGRPTGNTLLYIFSEETKEFFTNGLVVSGVRLTCGSLNMDIKEPEFDLSAKYRECGK